MRTRFSLALSALALAGLGTLGLSTEGCSATTHPPYPDIGSFCTAKAKAVCQIAPLCGIPADACQAYQDQQCTTAAQQSASATRVYSPDNAKRCVDAVSAAYGNNASKVTYQQLVGNGSINDLCNRVFSGSAKALALCTTDTDCENDLVCARSSPTSTASVCTTLTIVAQGQPCQNPGDTCDANSYCKLGPLAAECAPAAGPGEACNDAIPCINTQHCVAGTCTARADLGGSCLTNDDCGPNGPYCDRYANNICTIGLTFATGAYDCRGIAGLPTGSGGAGADAGSD